MIKVRVWQKGDTLNDVLYWTIYPLEEGVTASTITVYPTDRVELFTGILDKYGKEIYEGDIVKYPSEFASLGEEDIKSIVNWDFGKLDYMIDIIDTLEVIGNIYENPELLTQE